MPTKSMKFRLNILVSIAFIVAIAWVVINLFSTSVTNSTEYRAKANSSQFRSVAIPAKRGSIYAADGEVLAQSATVYNIILDPTVYRNGNYTLEQTTALANKLNEMFGVDKEKFIRMTEVTGAGANYQKVATRVEKSAADKLTEYLIEQDISTYSLYTEQSTRRYYPQNELAASVIGFLNGDGDGVYGLEAYYDNYLAGVDGRIISARNAKGQEMPYKYERVFDAQDGNSVYLTIDTTLQYYAERELRNAVMTHNPENRACAIIMNCKTGAILAMATCPGFDLNNPAEIYDENTALLLEELKNNPETAALYEEEYAKARESQWKNKAITEYYYPGSVFKVITGAAAYEERLINSESTFYCQTMDVSGVKFHCWQNKYSHGSQNLAVAMTNSCNPAFIQIGELLGREKFSAYYEAFGFTGRTGIDLPGEARSSIYYQVEDMGPVELASSSFGQTNKVTPIQMITAYAAAVNGGYLVTPYVVDKIVDENGTVVKTVEPNVRRQVISEETSAYMRTVLESVVNNNGGGNSYIQGYRIGGKSGTSEKQDENLAENRDDLYVSSYVGFAPADDPEIIMLVMVDRPTGADYYGSVVASPVVTNTFKDALPYLGFLPSYREEEYARMPIYVQDVSGLSVDTAKSRIENDGLKVKVVGGGEYVVGQTPARNSTISRGGTVILYTEQDYKEEYTVVPNVIGKSVSEANQILVEAGLNIKLSGASSRADATALMQNWAEGCEVPNGTVVEVTFAIHDRTG